MRDVSVGEVAVVGLGASGLAASRLLLRHGGKVYASDAGSGTAVQSAAEALRAEGAAVDIGGHDLDRIRRAALVVVSPGVPPQSPPLVAAREAGVEVISEVELALGALPSSTQIIAITGTNGKSTVTALVAHLLRALGEDAEACGNIGLALSEVALRRTPPTWLALEMSSFQLHDTPSLQPTVGIITNLAPDHLDRYPDVEAYYADKALLLRNATTHSIWVVNGDDPTSLALVEGVPGVLLEFSAEGRLCDAFLDRSHQALIVHDEPLMPASDVRLIGKHNVGNALAAALAVTSGAHTSLEARERVAAAVASFHALPHRLEPVGEPDGVLWINDSKATNVSSALVALDAMTRPTVLLLGGRHKGEPYTGLRDAIEAHCKAVLAYGEAAGDIMKDLGDLTQVERVDGTFAAVLQRARNVARPGDVVLLAPACSSYDMFTNYVERGTAFATFARGTA